MTKKQLNCLVNSLEAKMDNVNHPKHYCSHPSGVEAIEITEHLNFNLGNAIKYLWRKDLKGKPDEDLNKAIWYLEREIDRIINDKAYVEKVKKFSESDLDNKLVQIITQLAMAPYAPEMIPVFRDAVWKIKEKLK